LKKEFVPRARARKKATLKAFENDENHGVGVLTEAGIKCLKDPLMKRGMGIQMRLCSGILTRSSKKAPIKHQKRNKALLQMKKKKANCPLRDVPRGSESNSQKESNPLFIQKMEDSARRGKCLLRIEKGHVWGGKGKERADLRSRTQHPRVRAS